jgi:peroxidase
LVLGEDFMQKFGLYPLSSGYSDDYSGDFDPRITNPFAAAAFRFGHSLIPENIHLVHKDENGDLVPDDVPLRDAFSDMDHLRTPGGVDALLRGSVIEKSERGKHVIDFR